MNKIFQKLKNHKYRNLICVLGLVLVFIVLPNKAFASDPLFIKSILNEVFYRIGQLFGVLVTLLIGFLMRVAAYNDFTTSKAVELGWKLTRDVCNMFFIVILMIIAICTIIRVEAYNYKKMLPKLLVKAVLINFSLMFCGLLIDVSQVITLSFVSAFSTAGTGNFITGLGLDKVYALAKNGDIQDVTTSLLYGMILLGIATVVIAALVFVFLGRIIAFWILIVLSPFTFLASASGGIGSKYADQWWSEFTKYLIVGPVLAFFLWLSLSVMNQSSLGVISGTMSTGLPNATFSEGGQADNFVAFCISIAMLLGSLVAAQQIGTVGSGAAGKAMSGLKKTGMTWVNWGGRRLDDTVGKFSAKMAGGAFGLSGYLFDSDKYKNKFGKMAAGTANALLTLGQGKAASRAGMKVWKEGGMQWRVIPQKWKEAEQRYEMIKTAQGRGTAHEAFDKFKTDDETYQIESAKGALTQEVIKRWQTAGLHENTDHLKSVIRKGITGKASEAEVEAAWRLLIQNKDEDEISSDKELHQLLTDDDLKQMARTDENGELVPWERDEATGIVKGEKSNPIALNYLMKRSGLRAQAAATIGDGAHGLGLTHLYSQAVLTKGGYKYRDFSAREGESEYFNKAEIKDFVTGISGKMGTGTPRDQFSKIPGRVVFSSNFEQNQNTGEVISSGYGEQNVFGRSLLPKVAAEATPDRARACMAVAPFHLSGIDKEVVALSERDIINMYQKAVGEQVFPKKFFDKDISRAISMINAKRFEAGETMFDVDKLSQDCKDSFAGGGSGSSSSGSSSGSSAGGASTPPSGKSPIMADVDSEKYKRTKEKMEEYKDLDFYISDDYENSEDQYYDKGTMERITRTKEEEERKREKLARTKQKEEEYKKKGENFYKSKEYLDDQKRDDNGKYINEKLEYYAEEVMRQKTLIDPATGKDRIDTMTGVDSAKIKGQKGESAALAINADNDKLKGLMAEGAAGACLIGEDKEKAIEQLGAFYADQLKAQNEQLDDAVKLSDEQMQAEVDSLKNSLGQASSLRLVNKNREGYDAKSVLRHELMHDRIENADQDKLKEIWDSMDKDKKGKDKKAEINRRIRSEWTGGKDFTDEQVMNEYFVEGAANFGRKDTAGGIQLGAGQARALQQTGIKMKGVPEEEEDIKVKKMSRRALGKEAGKVRKKEKAEAKETAKQEKIKVREGKRIAEEPKLSEKEELKNAKADAQDRMSEYRQRATSREWLEKKLEDSKKALNEDKKSAQWTKQEAIQEEKEGSAKGAGVLRKEYNNRVESVKKNEKIVNQISKDVERAKGEENLARQKAQESSRNYIAKENVVKAKGVDGQIKEWQAKKGSVADAYEIDVPVTAKVKAPKIDFDQQIGKMEERKESARKFGAVDTERQLDQEIKELKEKKASASAEPAGGGFQKVDINKEIRDLSNTIRGLKEGLKNPAKSDGEKDSIRKDLGANNIKLEFAKEQKNKAIEQQIQELNQKKVGLSQSQKIIEQSKFSPSKMGVAPAAGSEPFSAKDFIKETSAAKETPPVYQVDETHNQEIVNNVTNVIDGAAEGGGLKELQNAVTNSLASPAGRYWIIKAIQKGMSDMPNNIKGLLSPDFANLVSDDEKAVQDKELAEKMKNYIGDVKIALGGLGKKGK